MTPKRILGSGTKDTFGEYTAELPAWKQSGEPWIKLAAADQIVTVSANVTLKELQGELSSENLCLPLPDPAQSGSLLAGVPGTVGGLIAANLPHGLSATYGGPRDWLLHAKVLFQGREANSGAKVVKSVAGYDVHKLYVGSWGRLGPVLEATLRVYPKASLQPTQGINVRDWQGEPVWILRTLPSDFQESLSQAQEVFCYDSPSCTIWSGMRPDSPRIGWIIGPAGERWTSSPGTDTHRQVKRVFDPNGEWL